MPNHSDRAKWRLLIVEFQARALLKGNASHSLDRGNFSVVRFSEIVKLFTSSLNVHQRRGCDPALNQ